MSLIISIIILSALYVIMTGIIMYARYIQRQIHISQTVEYLNQKLEATAWLYKYCERANDTKGMRSLILERYDILKERNFYV